MKKIGALILFLFSLAAQANALNLQKGIQRPRECIILLHGLGRSHHSLSKIEAELSRQSYIVVNKDYPSLKHPIEYLADDVLGPEIKRINEAPPSKIHFVTHSMGGIVVRYYLSRHPPTNLGRVVMLSPPNQGSELVDFMRQTPSFWKFLGPAALELGTDKDSLPQKLGRPRFELGVIAGNKTHNPLSSVMLDGPDDGTVTVKSTQIIGMRDFIVLPCSHFSIMKSEEAIEQILYFLEYGTFNHRANS